LVEVRGGGERLVVLFATAFVKRHVTQKANP
jgi:hypothetical protein